MVNKPQVNDLFGNDDIDISIVNNNNNKKNKPFDTDRTGNDPFADNVNINSNSNNNQRQIKSKDPFAPTPDPFGQSNDPFSNPKPKNNVKDPFADTDTESIDN